MHEPAARWSSSRAAGVVVATSGARAQAMATTEAGFNRREQLASSIRLAMAPTKWDVDHSTLS